jgi:hypothetical protein
VRRATGFTFRGAAMAYCRILTDEIRFHRRRNDQMQPSQVISIVGFFFFTYILGPFWALSALYSSIYPFFLFFTVPFSQQQYVFLF